MSDNNIKILQSILLFIVAIVLITKSSSERYEYIGEYKYTTKEDMRNRVAIFDKKTGDIYIASYWKPKPGGPDFAALAKGEFNLKNLEDNYSVKKANFKKMHKDSVMKKK